MLTQKEAHCTPVEIPSLAEAEMPINALKYGLFETAQTLNITFTRSIIISMWGTTIKKGWVYSKSVHRVVVGNDVLDVDVCIRTAGFFKDG